MTIDKEPKINIHIQEMYDQVKKQGGPTGIFTQSIVDEYHRLVKLASGPELETKKIRISFLKKDEKRSHQFKYNYDGSPL